MKTVLSLLAIILYLLSSYRLAKGLFEVDESNKRPYRIQFFVTGFAALFIHGYLVYQIIDIADGLNMGFYQALLLIAWCVSLVLLLTALWKPLANLALIIFPLICIALVLELVFQSQRILPETAPAGLRLHVLLSVIAFSVMSLGAIQSILLALQDHQLRNKKPGTIMRLPPMQIMEDLLIKIIIIGFCVLSLSLVTGLAFLEDIFAQHLIHKTVLSILAWVIFATALWGRWTQGWRGKTAAYWILGGYSALLLAYLGSKFVLELVLNRV